MRPKRIAVGRSRAQKNKRYDELQKRTSNGKQHWKQLEYIALLKSVFLTKKNRHLFYSLISVHITRIFAKWKIKKKKTIIFFYSVNFVRNRTRVKQGYVASLKFIKAFEKVHFLLTRNVSWNFRTFWLKIVFFLKTILKIEKKNNHF